MTRYKIEKVSWIGIRSYGSIGEGTMFHVYIQKSFLGIKYWSKINECTVLGSGAKYEGSLCFAKLEEAEKFVDKYHQHKDRIGKYQVTVVEVIEKP